MSFTCKIGGHTTWGSALSSYTVYKIDVTRLGKSWFIYRRYTAFTALHSIIIQEFGAPKVLELNMQIPEKDLLANAPSIISDSIMGKREQDLNEYLRILSEQTGWGERCAGSVLLCFTSFFCLPLNFPFFLFLYFCSTNIYFSVII
jgi:hypothetical protein